MRVLAVGAHPDDLEILCGGTLARFVAEGHQVVMAHACRGDKGHGQIPHAQVAEVRDREARAAAQVIGAEPMALGFPDCELYVDEASMHRFVDMIRAAKPDLIITHHPNDYHSDHKAVTKLVTDASFSATLPYFVTDEPAHPIAPPIFFMDTLAGLDFSPEEYVDITATFEIKKQAMSQHASQVAWISQHHATDILDMIETTARFRGWQCGVPYAEGFQMMREWGRVFPRRLLP
jgi:LmbE family N-acetylglucosaminyl deacetylase